MNEHESRTLVSPADSFDSPAHKKAASLLNPSGHLYTGPAHTDESLMIGERNTQFHSADQKGNIQ